MRISHLSLVINTRINTNKLILSKTSLEILISNTLGYGVVNGPKMLEGRAFYRLGEKVYDHHKKVLIVGILSCVMLGSLISMGPNWAESWGEGNLESVEAGDLRDSAFASDEEGVERFTLLINHPTLNDSSAEWQSAVIDALSVYAEMEDVTIEYSWETTGEKRAKFVHQDEDGFWAKNIVTIYLDRKEAKQVFADNWDSIDVDSEFNSWRTGGIAIDVVFDVRIQEDLIKAERFQDLFH